MSGSPSSRLLVVGSINADVFIEIDRLPVQGETIAANRPDTGFVLPGGKGANQSVAAAKLLTGSKTHSVSWCGRFGNDSHVPMLKKVLTSHNVDYSLATDASVPSGQAYILLQPDGQNSIILVGAANHSWPSELSPTVVAALSNTAVVMLQREIPESVNIAIATEAKKRNIPVFLDMGGEATPISAALLSQLTTLTANETELARVSSMPTDTDEEVVKAAQHVQAKFGVKQLLISLGSRGALYIETDGSMLKEPAVKVENIVDTTGAGDCFRGAFTVAFLEGKSTQQCLKFAAAAASICIQVKGALPSMPARQQVDELLAKL